MPFTAGNASGGTSNVAVTNAPDVTILGGEVETQRDYTYSTVTIPINTAVSNQAIDMRNYAGGVIYMPAGWTVADLGAQVSIASDGTFHTLKDRSNAYGTDVSIDGPVADAVYPIPPYWFGAHFLLLHSHNGAGVDVNQTAARSMVVMLKS